VSGSATVRRSAFSSTLFSVGIRQTDLAEGERSENETNLSPLLGNPPSILKR
jgi:hypothetical protein